MTKTKVINENTSKKSVMDSHWVTPWWKW